MMKSGLQNYQYSLGNIDVSTPGAPKGENHQNAIEIT